VPGEESDAMSDAMPDPLEYYAHPGPMTDPKKYASLFEGLPTTIPALCQVVQGLLIHIFWAERYGLALSDELELLDRLANLTLADNEAFPEVYAAYEGDRRLHVPTDVLA
jgi:hypothetical protein